jgi:hypothetical protein
MQDEMLRVPFRASLRFGRCLARPAIAAGLAGGLLAPAFVRAEPDAQEPVKAVASESASNDFVESGRGALRSFVNAWQLPSERTLGTVVNGTRLRHPTAAEQPGPAK